VPATAGQSNCECRKHLDGDTGSGDTGIEDTGIEGRGRDGDIGEESDAAGERADGDEGVAEGAGGGAGDSGVAGGGAADSGVAGGGAAEDTSVLDNAMQATAFHTYQVNTVPYRLFSLFHVRLLEYVRPFCKV
jgi:hypothetical protein